MLICFIYFEIHSCSDDSTIAPEPPVEIPNLLCNATDVFFLDADRGWIAGEQGTLLVTENGGIEWTAVKVEDMCIRSVTFLDGSNGWIAGSDSRIFKSVDGGYNWDRQLFPLLAEADDIFDVKFFDSSKGFVLGYEGVFVTDNGGSNWENNWLPIVSARGAWNMSMLDEERGFLLGSRWADADPMMLYRTDDGGQTWCGVEGSYASILRSILTISFLDDDRGWAGGGVIMSTLDGGTTWQVQLESATVREFDFSDEMNGYAVGGRSILKTTDGGTQWIDIAPMDERIVDLRGICFLDSNRGWVVGRGLQEPMGGKICGYSVVLSTVDGGDNWSISEFGYDVTDEVAQTVEADL